MGRGDKTTGKARNEQREGTDAVLPGMVGTKRDVGVADPLLLLLHSGAPLSFCHQLRGRKTYIKNPVSAPVSLHLPPKVAQAVLFSPVQSTCVGKEPR